jgi:hypothetical protein
MSSCVALAVKVKCFEITSELQGEIELDDCKKSLSFDALHKHST